jgi:hypothetical protein
MNRLSAVCSGFGLGVFVVLFTDMIDGRCPPPVTTERMILGASFIMLNLAFCLFHIFKKET